MIRCLVFDFDGVLVQSDGLKIDAYFRAFKCSNDRARNIIRGIVNRSEAATRYEVIGQIVREMQKAGLLPDDETEIHMAKIIERYNQITEEAVARCEDVAGASSVLEGFVDRLPMYINSATPTAPLKRIVAARRWTSYFRDVLGADHSKADNLAYILRQEGLSPAAVLFVGDSPNDQRAANDVGVHFVGIQSETGGIGKSTCHTVLPDLKGLSDYIISSDFARIDS